MGKLANLNPARALQRGFFWAGLLLALAQTACWSGETYAGRLEGKLSEEERSSVKAGWRRELVKIGEVERRLLWKTPEGAWRCGAIIAMHGGGGSYTNFAAAPRLCRPMMDFADAALARGFAVFSLDSTEGGATDVKGRNCGKRWDCMPVEGRANIDLPFLEKVISETVPTLRPAGSSVNVFLTGISNGGYMTILAAAHFPGKLRAFAPISAGDPFGTHMDMGVKPAIERDNAPGVFLDNDTGREISIAGAADAREFQNEKPWPKTAAGDDAAAVRKPPFMQFHHRLDGVCDISCMERARKQLVANGFMDSGAFIVEGSGRRRLLNHFWQSEYNKPLLDFFEKNASQPPPAGR